MTDTREAVADPTYRYQISSAIKCIDSRDLDGAADACGAALQQNAGRHEAYFLFAVIAFLVEDLGRAIEMAQKGHDIAPNCAEGCDILAHIHAYAGNLNDSVYFGKLATTGQSCPVLSSLKVSGLDDLAGAMDEVRETSYKVEALRAYFEEDYDRCVTVCEKEMRLNSGDVELFQLYGHSLIRQGLFSRGIAALHGALHLDNDNADSYLRLGEGYVLRGEPEIARACFARALELSNDTGPTLATVSRFRGFLPGSWPVFDAAVKKWARQVETGRDVPRTSATDKKDKNKKDKDKKNKDRKDNIRVGLLIDRACSSEELRYLEPWFWQLDRDLIDVFVYSVDRPGDSVPSKLQGLTEMWIDISDVNEATLGATIAAHDLDILVDVRVRDLGKRSGIAAGAPVGKVVRWNVPDDDVRACGYTVVVCDNGVRIPKKMEDIAVRSAAALPALISDGLPAIEGMSPVQTLGHITFGATCDLSRITPHVVMVWSKILHAISGSRLLLGNVGHISPDVKSRYQEMFSCFGCMGRVDFAPLASTAPEAFLLSRLEFLVGTDVYLDAFPNGGGIELADPLWSGIPVIGHTRYERPGSIGHSVLRAGNQDKWLARNDKEYITLALKAAESVSSDAAWRSTMHEAVKNSALFDAEGWGREMTALLMDIAGGD